MLKLRQVSTSSCQTIIDVEGTILRLFIIVGGTPALSFDDHSFCQTYPKLEKYQDWDDRLGKYLHQTLPIQGPLPDDLPEGENTISKYLADNLERHDRLVHRMARLNGIFNGNTFLSPRIHDKENGAYCHMKLSWNGNFYCPVVLCESSYELGTNYTTRMLNQTTEAWKRAALTLMQTHGKTLESLNNVEFDLMAKAIQGIAQ